MSFKKPVSVLVLIHSPALEVLLIERAAHPGFWQSVTGSQEDDEPLALTAARELHEETGILAQPGQIEDWHQQQQYEIFPQWRHRYAPGTTHNTEHVFSICVPRDTPVTLAPGEHRAWRWLPWREAAAACFSESNRDAILALPARMQAG
ncbi:dihydroneopterin triphosphate diphosphatase [Niveibacterium sp. 24ML]|uniref:dihydroneopterin triphosphate diphosphatase n=1 Tax=Niveibacterium sp. 24ML TaxID=2985512 RepID=UPI00226EC9D1|nr:dihydroneopterin triphosphate diphosphatase [Niveibacterium sp. 24ML]MCX9156844.1 dihydroneopterin triphosphate diphosphatase [Niveibacterium sp. 24ML]